MKKKQRLFVIENFQLLQFINVIIFTLYHIFWINANILSDGIELIRKEVLNLRELSESEIYLNFLIHYYYYYIIMIIIFLILMKPRNY